MATLDFTPLFRTTVGFDRVPMLLSQSMQRTETAYPPYNIEKSGENEYRIVIAVAGFKPEDLEIVREQNQLTVRGEVKQRTEHQYLHRGIATRDFVRAFDLADFIEVTGAAMGDGLLIIDLKREIPESMKPRKIEIGKAQLRHVEHQRSDKRTAAAA